MASPLPSPHSSSHNSCHNLLLTQRKRSYREETGETNAHRQRKLKQRSTRRALYGCVFSAAVELPQPAGSAEAPGSTVLPHEVPDQELSGKQALLNTWLVDGGESRRRTSGFSDVVEPAYSWKCKWTATSDVHT